MPARILLVEADPAQQVGLRSALAASGYRLGSAADAAAAASMLQAARYDLVLLGPGQPDGPARDAAALIGAAVADPPPVIALTALPDCMIGRDALGTGGTLPAELPAVLEALTRYMRFAPSRAARSPRELERLVGEWAEYDRNPGPA